MVVHFLLSLDYRLELIIFPATGPLGGCLTYNTSTHSSFPTVNTYLRLGFFWLLLALHWSGRYSGSPVLRVFLDSFSSFCNCFFLSLWNKNAPYSILDLISTLQSLIKITEFAPHQVCFTQFKIFIGFPHFLTNALISSSQSRLNFKCRPKNLIDLAEETFSPCTMIYHSPLAVPFF
jgi:hypothetical protein